MPEFLESQVGKFTFKVAADRLYTEEGVWALATGNRVRMGLSDYVQQRSGDIAFADVKPEGTILAVGSEIVSIETIKVNVYLTSPVAGTIVQVNRQMENTPEMINQDPYGEGWLCEVEAADWEKDQMKLLTPPAYFAQMKQEAEREAGNND